MESRDKMRKILLAVAFMICIIPSIAFGQAHPNIDLDHKEWYSIGEVGDPVSLYPYTAGTDYFAELCGGINHNGADDLVCVNQYTNACELIVAAPAAGFNVNIISPLGTRPAAQSVSTAPPTDAYYMVSRTAAANAVGNPLWFQISQDGATAVGAANPLPISATMAANAVGNPIYSAVSKNAAANALANPIYIQISQDGTNAVGAANPLPISRTMAANTTANVIYTGISDGTNLAAVESDLSAGKATTINALDTIAYMYAYNGATFDYLLTGAVGELLVTDVATRPGEDAANDWRKVKKEAIGTYAPIKETSGSVGTAAVIVLAWKEILGYPNCTIYLKNNDGADPFTDAAIAVSPDGVNGVVLNWDDCDTLGAGNVCVYQLQSQSYRYIAVSVNATDANPVSSVDAWITCNVD